MSKPFVRLQIFSRLIQCRLNNGPGVRYDAPYGQNMTNFPEYLFRTLRGILLTERERTAIRMQVEIHVREHPFAAPVTMFGKLAQWGRTTTDAINDFLEARTVLSHPAFAAAVLVLCVGSATSYAATFALPGDPLYSFKTRVNEPIVGITAFSPVAKAQWSARLANRRLEEAELLAASGKLTPVNSAAIVTGINTAVADFDTNVARLALRSEKTDVADAQSDLEASFNAHETVLASLTQSADNMDVDPIVASVREHAETISNGRFATEVAIAENDSTSTEKSAKRIKRNAEIEIKQVAQFTAQATDMTVASSVASVSQDALNDIQAGDTEAKRGKWGKAYGAFQSAARKLKETQTTLDARAKLRAKKNSKPITATSTIATSTIATTTDTNIRSENDGKDASSSESTRRGRDSSDRNDD